MNMHDLINEIRSDRVFNDEPRVFSYGTYLKSTRSFSDGIPMELKGFGYSFNSPSYALFKSLMEAIERLSNATYLNKEIKIESYNNMDSKSTTNPNLWIAESNLLNKEKIGWVNAQNLTDKSNVFIPAQSVYINYRRLAAEPYLTDTISTGTAAGTDTKEVLVKCILEIIERDCFMSIYLNKISPPQVALEKLGLVEVDEILEKSKRNNLEVYVFKISNDLEIPAFMSLIIDRTGLGPAVTVGLKCSNSYKDGIIGCIEEGFLSRPWLRFEYINLNGNVEDIDPKKINNLLKRGLYWADISRIKNLNFLFKQNDQICQINDSKIDTNNDLTNILNKLGKKNIAVYYKDITSPVFYRSPYKVYKVIIPQLQPLYLNEQRKEIRMKRLKEVNIYFKNSNYKLNKEPHPFL